MSVQKIHVTGEGENGSGPNLTGEPVSGSRAELAVRIANTAQAIHLLRALRESLPHTFTPTARTALVYLLVPDAGDAEEVINLGTSPRELMETRLAELNQQYADYHALLDALPLRFPSEAAERAFLRLVKGQ